MPSFRPQHPRVHSVSSLAEAFGFALDGDGTEVVSGVASGSHHVVPGDVFVAMPGATTHGIRFAADAIERGATAVLTDSAGAAQLGDHSVPVVITDDPRGALGPVSAWVYGTTDEEDGREQVFGVTGTNGKTSVVTILTALLHRLGRTVALSSTAERRIEDDVEVSGLTTPEANELHALLATARERGVHTAVLEVSAHALTRHRVDAVVFDVVGFSNLSHDHLDDYADMTEYYEAKRELFTPEHAERGVIVVDDDWGVRLVGESRIPVTTLSVDSATEADWHVSVTAETAEYTAFRLANADQILEARVPLLGAFSATNAALAIVMAVEAGYDLEHIGEALKPDGVIDAFVPGRAERVAGERGPLVLIDYAHTPEAFRHLLDALRRVATGRVIMVFGADGDRDRSKRAEMGAIAARGADELVITDFHPRFEDPATIRAALIAGAAQAVPDRVITEIADPREAFRFALAQAGENDIVLYAGPGHEDYHEVAGVKLAYSAREDARAALREAGWLDD